MAIKSIETVSVDDGPVGEIFGCKIFNLSLNIGYDKDPTTLSLNIVREDGVYPDIDAYLSYLNPYKVNIDNISIYLYLVKTSSRTSAESKTLTLDFVDGSHILDRVFVGMINKHTTSSRHMQTSDTRFNVPVCCPDCHGDPYADLSTTMKNMTAVRKVSYSNGTPIGNNVDGGFVFVGVEGFGETDCDIGQVNYSLNDLVIACSNIGIELVFPQPESYNYFIRSHTGSLRKVLRSWCAELNYTFGWNWSEEVGRVDFINLEDGNAVLPSKITEIKDIVDNMDTSDQPIVLDLQESTSIKETSRDYNVTFYQASKLQAGQDRSVNYLQHFAGLYVDDIVHAAELGKSRQTAMDGGTFIHDRYDYAEFCTSMSLSSVSQSAADIYNASKGYLGYFGYTNWKKIGNNAIIIDVGSGPTEYQTFKEDLIGLVSGGTNGLRDQIEKYYKNIFRLNDTQAASLSSQVNSIPKEWFDVYVAVKPSSDTGGAATKSYEKNIASSFAGKYFWSHARPKKYRTCTKSLSYDVSFEYTPSVTDVYSPAVASLARHITTVNANAPWYQLIGPKYGMQSFLWPQSGVTDMFGQPTRGIWTHTPIKVMEREAKFGNVVQWDVYNNRDSTVVKKGSPMSELCRDTCGIDLFDQFKPMVSKWKHGQPGVGSTSIGGGVGVAMNAVRQYLENNPNSSTALACGQEVFAGQQVEVFVIPVPFMIAKFMNVVPVEDTSGNFNTMSNPEEETYIQNIKTKPSTVSKIM